MRIRVSKSVFWSVTLLALLGLGGGILYVSGKPAAPSPPSPAVGSELSRLAKGRGDKGFPGHGYTEVYERFLGPWKNEPIRIVEIGIAPAGALGMWQDYFPRATVYGIDLKAPSPLVDRKGKTCSADQTNRALLKKCMDEFGGQFDLIIDGGVHGMAQQQVSFGFLFPYLRPGGFYAIEAVHTSLPNIYPGFGVEPDEGNSTLAMFLYFARSAPQVIASPYMLPEERGYLNTWIETADLHTANNAAHSMLCIFKKRAPNPLLDEAAPAAAGVDGGR